VLRTPPICGSVYVDATRVGGFQSMRLIPVLTVAALLSVPGSFFGEAGSPQASANVSGTQRGSQDWTEFASREDRFTCNFPGQPVVTQTTWTSEYGAVLPARVYSAELGSSRYSMMVADYRDIEKILTERSKSCPAGAETCGGGGATGLGYWKVDLQGALVYATWKVMQRPGVTVTHLMWNFMDLVNGHQLQLTNTDKSRTFASIYMHENKLYVMEGTVPDGYPEPGLFQQSLGWLDEAGNGIRYQSIYLHGAPPPPVNSRGGQGGFGRINAPGAPAAQDGAAPPQSGQPR